MHKSGCFISFFLITSAKQGFLQYDNGDSLIWIDDTASGVLVTGTMPGSNIPRRGTQSLNSGTVNTEGKCSTNMPSRSMVQYSLTNSAY